MPDSRHPAICRPHYGKVEAGVWVGGCVWGGWWVGGGGGMGKRESLCNTHPCRVFLSSHARHSRTCTRTPSLSPHQDPSTTRLSQGRDVRVWVGVCGHHRTGQPNKGSCVRRPAQFSEANSVGCRPYLCQRWTIPPRYQVTAWGRGGGLQRCTSRHSRHCPPPTPRPLAPLHSCSCDRTAQSNT